MSSRAAACLKGHPLVGFRAPHQHFVCDGCKAAQPVGAAMQGCRACDYDLCARCAAAPPGGDAALTARRKERVRDWFAGRVSAAALLVEGAEWEIAPDTMRKVFGREEQLRWLRRHMPRFRSMRTDVLLLIAEGDDVVAHTRADCVLRTGEPYQQRYFWAFRFTPGRADTVTRVIEYPDTLYSAPHYPELVRAPAEARPAAAAAPKPAAPRPAAFRKGEWVWYGRPGAARAARQRARVTVADTSHSPPSYVVRFDDGRERETEHDRLAPYDGPPAPRL